MPSRRGSGELSTGCEPEIQNARKKLRSSRRGFEQIGSLAGADDFHIFDGSSIFSTDKQKTFPFETGGLLLLLPAMRTTIVDRLPRLFIARAPGATKSVPTTRRTRASLRLRHATSSSTSSTSSSSSSSLPPPPFSSPFLPLRSSTAKQQNQDQTLNSVKIVWVQPLTTEAAQAAAESGVRVLLFDERDAASAADFANTLIFDTIVRFDDGLLADATGRSVGLAVDLRTPADVRSAEALAYAAAAAEDGSPPKDDDDSPEDSEESVVLADARDWAVIPAENLVAAFQEARRREQASWEAAVRKSANDENVPLPKRPRPKTPRLLMTASTTNSAITLLGALESGVDGVVLKTGDPREVRALCAAVLEAASAKVAVKKNSGSDSSSGGSNSGGSSSDDAQIEFEVGVVSSMSPAGMGDRVCVDLTVLLEPGEGLLVGSFASAALLVHSERGGGGSSGGSGSGSGSGDASYISPRPFRVNAGAVHSYVDLPRGRTAYLSELKAGSEVLVVRPPSSDGTSTMTSTAVVGRAKVERRPMLKIDVNLADGSKCSAVLQNAETVRLVAPKSSGAFAPLPPSAAAAAAAKPSRRRRLGAEDEEALRWAMDPSPPSLSAASPSSAPEKLEADAEKALDWVMGPSASSNSYPSSHPLSSPSSSSFSEEDGSDSDGAEALVEGPPHRPYLLPRNDSKAVAALRWLLGGKRTGGEEEAKSSSPSSSSSRGFPSKKWDPRETEGWTTVAVTDLVPGQPLLVRRAAAARHTGIEIDEWIVER